MKKMVKIIFIIFVIMFTIITIILTIKNYNYPQNGEEYITADKPAKMYFDPISTHIRVWGKVYFETPSGKKISYEDIEKLRREPKGNCLIKTNQNNATVKWWNND